MVDQVNDLGSGNDVTETRLEACQLTAKVAQNVVKIPGDVNPGNGFSQKLGN